VSVIVKKEVVPVKRKVTVSYIDGREEVYSVKRVTTEIVQWKLRVKDGIVLVPFCVARSIRVVAAG
jgi:hypothetical protein